MRCKLASFLLVVLAVGLFRTGHAADLELPATRLRIVGGLADVSQYTQHEAPFWTTRIAALSGGRVTADIAPFDRSGIRGQEVLRLLSLGVIQFGTVILSLAAEDPELAAMDLPLLSPDFESLRRVVTAYRPVVARFLKERYGLELLAVFTYSAQVMYCRDPFRDLDDLKGRRIRTSGASQAELVDELGGIPVVTSFADIVPSVERNVVDCAITGALSGNSIGLHEVTTHIHELAVNWGVSVFAANGEAWAALAPPVRDLLRRGIAGLEADIWRSAAHATEQGLACNTGSSACAEARRGRMTRVFLSPRDARRVPDLVAGAVLPGWLSRCGDACAREWNGSIGPLLSLTAKPPGAVSTE